jgi:hypothetical protein
MTGTSHLCTRTVLPDTLSECPKLQLNLLGSASESHKLVTDVDERNTSATVNARRALHAKAQMLSVLTVLSLSVADSSLAM